MKTSHGMNKTLWILVVAVLIIGAGIFFFAQKGEAPSVGDDVNLTEEVGEEVGEEVSQNGTSDESQIENEGNSNETSESVTITYSNDGFSPKEVTVAPGTRVIFQNNSSRNFWPASAAHPTHEVYSGTSRSEHCNDENAEAFDACGGIPSGGLYMFVFDKVGEWGYHDHLRASETGRIIVNE